MVQNGSFLEYANNRNLTDQEAEASFNVLKEFVRKANDTKTFDNKLLKFLQGILYFQSPYIAEGEETHKNPVARNQFYFHQGNLFFGEKEFAVPFTSASMEANKETVMAFLKGSYNHINNKFLTDPILRSQPFIEYTGNLVEKEWANYQTYLLSTEGRKAGEVPLSTNIRAKDPLIPDDRNFNNKYSYSNLLKQEDVNYKKPEPEEEGTLRSIGASILSKLGFKNHNRQANGNVKGGQSGWKIRFNIKNPETGESYFSDKEDLMDENYFLNAKKITDFLVSYFGNNTKNDSTQQTVQGFPVLEGHYKAEEMAKPMNLSNT
jgi:hypothetical protein